MDGSPWGGSEELWSGAAIILAQEGLEVGASVHEWFPLDPRITALAKAGVKLRPRRARQPLWRRGARKLVPGHKSVSYAEVACLMRDQPGLVVICNAGATPPVDLLEQCAARNVPFVTVSQANSELFWPEDNVAAAYRRLLPRAKRCFFVSNANKCLFEKQIGCELPNTEIVWNPFNVDVSASPSWPPLTSSSQLLLACVARLHPPSKGQDLLLEALADPVWRNREWRLMLYGSGPMKVGIERLIEHFKLSDRVKLGGFVNSVESIWSQNHVLVLPSRYEGMPLAMVEAMWCGRPVFATNVAGHSEIIADGITGFLADAPTVPSIKNALERLWSRRMDLEIMGRNAAAKIRSMVPPSPSHVFADRLKDIGSI